MQTVKDLQQSDPTILRTELLLQAGSNPEHKRTPLTRDTKTRSNSLRQNVVTIFLQRKNISDRWYKDASFRQVQQFMDTLVSTCKNLMIKLGIAKRLHYSIQHVQPSQDPVAQQLDNVLASTIHREAIQHLRDQRREAAATSISEPQQSLNSQPSSSWQHRVWDSSDWNSWSWCQR